VEDITVERRNSIALAFPIGRAMALEAGVRILAVYVGSDVDLRVAAAGRLSIFTAMDRNGRVD